MGSASRRLSAFGCSLYGRRRPTPGKAWTMSVSRHPSRADLGGTVLSLQQAVREPRRA